MIIYTILYIFKTYLPVSYKIFTRMALKESSGVAFCLMAVLIFIDFHSLGHKHVFLSSNQDPGTSSTSFVSKNSTTAKPILNKNSHPK